MSTGAAQTDGLGEQLDAEAQEAVGAELQHHRGQDDRAGGGRLGVGIGQPGVQREQRHLDREGDCEGDEDPACRRSVEIARLSVIATMSKVSGVARGAALQHSQGDDADQHQSRAEHRVEEELGRRVDATAVAPQADEEVHRHQHDLEEHEEHDQVEGAEHADRAGLRTSSQA